MIPVARVEIDELTKQFRGATGELIAAVDALTLSVAEGELLVILGPSGSGKTTTLRLVAGLEQPTNGTIRIDGQVMNGVDPGLRDVAMVFQNQALYPHLSVYENLALGLELRKVPRKEIETRVREAAAALDLAGCLERKPESLSGGQRQRVALGRALVRKPGLFLFDEPLSNLDPRLRLQMRAEVSRLHARLGATMIYVTHDQGEAMALANRIAVLKDGVLQQVAEPLKIYEQPGNLFVAGFVGSPPMNLFHGRIAREPGGFLFRGEVPAGVSPSAPLVMKLDAALNGRLERFLDRPVVMGLRPELFTWSDTANPTPDCAKVEAVVEVVEKLGPETYIHLDGGGQRFIARVPAGATIPLNQRTVVCVNLRQAHFFDPGTGKVIGDSSR
jgi:multiple sugar transport system ATP-binding protein